MAFVRAARRQLPGLILALALAGRAGAAAPDDCGTVIIPPGVGLGPGSDITSFNPLLVQSEYNLQAANLMFAQLVWINRLHQIDYSRSVASAVTTPDHGKTYKVTLRPWHWSDGAPVTAADVAYTLRLIRALGTTWTEYGTGGMPGIIQSFSIADPTHFTIVLKNAVNPDWFIMNGLQLLQPLPAHVWGRYTLDQIWQNQSTPRFFSVVDGPLVVRRLVVGQDAVFAPNPRYDGPPMHFHRFILKFENNEGMALQAVESHEVDISNLPFSLWDAAQHLPGLHIVPLAAVLFLARADPEHGEQEHRVFRRCAGARRHGRRHRPAADRQPRFPRSRRPGARSGAARAAAVSLAGGAGWRLSGWDMIRPRPGRCSPPPASRRGRGGILRKDGRPFAFTLMIPADQTMRIEMAEVIQQDLRAVGIDMKVSQVEFNQMMALNIGPAAGWQAMLFASDGKCLSDRGIRIQDRQLLRPPMAMPAPAWTS